MQCTCNILSSVTCPPTLPNFSTLSDKRQDFQKNVILHKMSVSIFSTNFVWNIFHSKKHRARYDQNGISVCCTYSGCYSCPIIIKPEFSKWIFKKYNIKFHKIHPMGAESFHRDGLTDRWTGMTNLTVTFCNFANMQNKNDKTTHCYTWLSMTNLKIIKYQGYKFTFLLKYFNL